MVVTSGEKRRLEQLVKTVKDPLTLGRIQERLAAPDGAITQQETKKVITSEELKLLPKETQSNILAGRKTTFILVPEKLTGEKFIGFAKSKGVDPKELGRIRDELILQSGRTILESKKGVRTILKADPERAKELIKRAIEAGGIDKISPEIIRIKRAQEREIKGFKEVFISPPEFAEVTRPSLQETVTQFQVSPLEPLIRGPPKEVTAITAGELTPEALALASGEIESRTKLPVLKEPEGPLRLGQVFPGFESPALTASRERLAKEERKRFEKIDPISQFIEQVEGITPAKTGREEDIGRFIISAGVGAALFFPRLVKMPEVIVEIATDPISVAQATITEFVADPVRQFGELAGGIAVGAGIGLGIRKVVTKFRGVKVQDQSLKLTEPTLKIEPIKLDIQFAARLRLEKGVLRGPGVTRVVARGLDKTLAKIESQIEATLGKAPKVKLVGEAKIALKPFEKILRIKGQKISLETVTKKGLTITVKEPQASIFEAPGLVGFPAQARIGGGIADLQTVFKSVTKDIFKTQQLVKIRDIPVLLERGKAATLTIKQAQFLGRPIQETGIVLERATVKTVKGQDIFIKEVARGKLTQADIIKGLKDVSKGFEKFDIEKFGVGKFGREVQVGLSRIKEVSTKGAQAAQQAQIQKGLEAILKTARIQAQAVIEPALKVVEPKLASVVDVAAQATRFKDVSRVISGAVVAASEIKVQKVQLPKQIDIQKQIRTSAQALESLSVAAQAVKGLEKQAFKQISRLKIKTAQEVIAVKLPKFKDVSRSIEKSISRSISAIGQAQRQGQKQIQVPIQKLKEPSVMPPPRIPDMGLPGEAQPPGPPGPAKGIFIPHLMPGEVPAKRLGIPAKEFDVRFVLKPVTRRLKIKIPEVKLPKLKGV